MGDKWVELAERAFVEEKLQTLSGGVFSLVVLAADAGFTTT